MTVVRQRLLQDSLLASAESQPRKTAVVAGPERLSYEEFLDSSLRLARGFQGLGLERGGLDVLVGRRVGVHGRVRCAVVAAIAGVR